MRDKVFILKLVSARERAVEDYLELLRTNGTLVSHILLLKESAKNLPAYSLGSFQ